MSDLRTGLVEAVAKAMYEGITGLDDWEDEATYAPEHAEATRNHASAVLDAALGFLIDNADEWRREVNLLYKGFAGSLMPEGTSVSISGTPIDQWLAALSDSRDTGEKP